MTIQRIDSDAVATVIDLGERVAAVEVPSVSLRVRRPGHRMIVTVAGDMDIQVPPLLLRMVVRDATFVVLDLHRVNFIDACGLGALLATQRRIVESGGRVRLAAPSVSVQRLLRLTDTEREFATFESLEQALTSPYGVASRRPHRAPA